MQSDNSVLIKAAESEPWEWLWQAYLSLSTIKGFEIREEHLNGQTHEQMNSSPMSQ